MTALAVVVEALAALCAQSGKAPDEFDGLTTWTNGGDRLVIGDLRPVVVWAAP